jgi:hypothetical protein
MNRNAFHLRSSARYTGFYPGTSIELQPEINAAGS